MTQAICNNRTDLVGQPHWHWNVFFTGQDYAPFLITRAAEASTQQIPWDRYAIGLEFEKGRLRYGIRFAITKWTTADTGNAAWAERAADKLAQLLGVGEKPNPWWPWYTWVNIQTEADLYAAIADNSLITLLQAKVNRIAQALNSYCSSEA